MPLIEFIGPSGERIERLVDGHVREVTERGRRYHRAPVQSFSVHRGLGQVDQRDEVFRGYYREECLNGSRFRSKYSKGEIKKAWEKPCRNVIV